MSAGGRVVRRQSVALVYAGSNPALHPRIGKSMYVSCWKIRQLRPAEEIPACCESCHLDDEEFGYDLCAVDDPEGHCGNHSGGVCCTVSLYLDKYPLTQKEWDHLEDVTEVGL